MHFDWTITFGDLIKSVVLVAGLIIGWMKLVGRLERVEEWIRVHQKCAEKQEEVLNEVREVLAFVRGKISVKAKIR